MRKRTTPYIPDLSEKLSPHFILREFVVSQTAARRGIPNLPEPEHVRNLRLLCENILEPARVYLGPIIVNSGYRSPPLNHEIGGASRSQHKFGQAGDVVPARVSLIRLYNYIAFESGLFFDQIIYEFESWVHLSYVAGKRGRGRGRGRNRMQRLRADRPRRRTVYSRVEVPLVA